MFAYLLFFLLEVAGHFDEFHSVQEGTRNGLKRVGCSDEEHFAQVVIHLKVVVVERAVLFGVKHFKQRGSGVSVEIRGHFVYLVKNKDGVGRLHFFEAFHYTTRHSANVGFSVSAYFGLVVQTAQTDSRIFPAESRGYTASEAGFAHTRRAIQAEDRRLVLVGVFWGFFPRHLHLS